MMVSYKNANGNEVGTYAHYDKPAKKMTMALATRLNFADHSLAMKVNNSGVAQFLFGWRQNSATLAQVGTSVNLADAANGRIKGFPLSF
jgi:hypothetical protein